MLKYPLVALVFTRKGRSVGGIDVFGQSLETSDGRARMPLPARENALRQRYGYFEMMCS
jgi:hypothetical protein